MAVQAQLADGRILEFPDGTDPAVIQSTVKRVIASTQPQQAGFSLGDIAASFAQGAYGSTQALTDVFGAGNTASSKLEELARASQADMTPGRQAELLRQQARAKAAEQTGSSWEEIKAAVQNVAESPLQSAAQAVGSFVPYIPAMFAGPAAAALGLGARATAAATAAARVAPGVIGTAQGAGAVKGAIYDAVYEAEIKDGTPEDQARAKAEAAQNYAGANIDQIASGAGIGYVAGRFGAERLLSPGAAATASRSAAGRVGTALATDVPTEALQGGQERLAANIALQREGMDVPTFQGVAGQAAQEGILGALGAGPIAAVRGPDVAALQEEERRKELEAFEAEKAKVLAAMEPEPVEPEEPVSRDAPINMPGGFTIQREELSRETVPESYGIFAEGQESPLTKVASMDEANQKAEAFKEIRQKEQENLLRELDKVTGEAQKRRDRIDQLEATGQTATEEYQGLKANIDQLELESETKAREIAERMEQLGRPLNVAPIGEREQINERFNLISPVGRVEASFGTPNEAEASLRELFGEDVFKQFEDEAAAAKQKIEAAKQKKFRDKRVAALEEQLVPKLRQFGLQDVGLKIVDQIENGAGGAYLNKLIRVAFDEANPLQTVRHESMHALKELGFFTPQQWKALELRAERQWIKEFLENQITEIDGVQMTRLEGYQKLGLSREAIIEEAIADAFGAYARGVTPPPGMIAALFKKLKNFFANFGQALRGAGFESADDIFQRVERGELKAAKAAEPADKAKFSQKKPPAAQEEVGEGAERPAAPSKPSTWKADKKDIKQADKYFDENGVMPYTSEGQIDVPLDVSGAKYSIKKPYDQKTLSKDQTLKNDPLTGLPMNANGTVTLYFPTDNAGARDLAKTKRLKGHSPEANRIYLTNESSAAAVQSRPGMIDQPLGGANVLLQVDPSLLHVLEEYEDGRKDFFIPIAEGEYFAKKMAQTKLFTLNAPRTKGLHADRTLSQVTKMVNDTADAWAKATKKERAEMAKNAKITLRDQHNIEKLFGANSKLEKTNIGEYGLTYKGKKVMSTGLGFASAQKINDEQRATTCPQSAICEALCLGETSGQNRLYGGDGPFRSGPRLSQFLKTEALVVNPEAFTIQLIKQIETFRNAANKLGYQPAIRLNVTSDFNPKTFENVINMFPDVMFYDYTKLDTKPIAPNHHLTYSSTGASQVVDGEAVLNKESNWDRMVDKILSNGKNVAMAFTSRSSMPKFILDERTGKTFEVWNGDEYDARFLDPVREDGKGLIVGLTNKDNTTKPEEAAKKHNGFFLDYDPQRDGDTLVIRNQANFKPSADVKTAGKVIPIAKLSLKTSAQEFKRWFGDSKVMDKQGNPLVVYHSTFSDFTKPRVNYGDDEYRRFGFHVGSSEAAQSRLAIKEAEDAGNRERSGNAGPNVMPLYVRTENPLRLDENRTGRWGVDDIMQAVMKKADRGQIDALSAEDVDAFMSDAFDIEQWLEMKPDVGEEGFDPDSPSRFWSDQADYRPGERSELLRDFIKRLGYDGIVYRNEFEGGGDSYILLDPEQIKSATGNIGTYKSSSPDIRYSLKRVGFPSVSEAKKAVAETDLPSTQEFKTFIGGSKWLDKNGEPMRFYHATAREFFEFTPAGQSNAIFLATTPEEAETFGSIAEDRLRREVYKAITKDEKLAFFQRIVDAEIQKGTITEKEGAEFIRQAKRKVPDYGNFGDIEAQVYDALLDLSPTRMSIMPLYARAETPFDFENPQHVEQVMRYVATETQYPQDFPEKWLAGMKGRISQGLWQAIEDKRVQQAIRALGFDAFAVRENRNSPKNYAVYQPQQVKSITGNDGQFSLENKDMRFSLKNVRYSPERFQTLYDESVYYRDGEEKKTKGYLAFVDPMEFVEATANRDMFARLRSEEEPVDFEKMRGLHTVPTLNISIRNGEWKIIGHEGRHRMLALHNLGYKNIPVFIQHATAIDNAEPLRAKMIKSQFDDALSSTLMAIEIEPLSYANKDKAMEKFTGMDSKVKYSLPKMPAALDARVSERVTSREEKTFVQSIIDAISPRSREYFRQKAINRYDQLSKYDKKLVEQMGGKELLADQSAEAAALMSDLGSGVAASAMGFGDRHGGIPVYKNGVTTIDRSVKGLIASLAPLARHNDPKIYQYYQYWAMVKRGVRLNAQGKETGIDNTDVQYAKYLQQKFPEFVQVQKDFIAFNNGLVKYAKDTGVISEQNAQEFVRYADYVPFYRQMDGETTVGPNIFQSITEVKGPKKLKGGTGPLADFLETAVRNTTSMIQAGMKNSAGQRAVDVVTKVKAPGMGAERLDHDASGPDIFHVLEKGKRVSYRTPDHLLLDAISSMHMPELPFMGILSAPANMLRNLVTKDPGFMMANLLRDSLSSYVTSGQKMTPIAGTVINFGKVLAGKSKGFEALMDAGVIGGYELSQNIERSGYEIEQDLAKKAGKKAPLPLRPFTWLWEGLEKGTEASDAATRAMIYERVLKDTGNEAEALFRSLEVMNFNRKGNSPLIRVLTAAVPFLNARIQGLDLFYRASTGNMNMADKKAIQRKFWARGATMMALSCMYWALVHDDEEYKTQEQETRDNNWLITGLGIKIPIPFEVGVLFKTIPERIMAYSFGNDTGKDLMDSMKRNAISTFAFNPIPQTVKPLVEATTNFNFFTWRPIIGQGMQDVALEYQVGPGTSKAAKFLGEQLGLSPMKVDHVIKGYTGTMGTYAVDLMDSIMDQFGDSPKAAKRFEQMPVIKRFTIDPEARGTVTAYYELKDAVDTTVRTMNLLESSMEPEKFAEYLKENMGTLAVKDYVRDLEGSMKEFREMRNLIRNSSMTAEQKRDGLLTITSAENNLTQNIQEVKKAIASLQ